MLAKLKWMLLVALAAVLVLGGSATAALAQGEDPPAGDETPTTRWGAGKVTAVDGDSFTLLNLRNQVREILVTNATLYFNQDGEPASLADIQVGDRVTGVATVLEDGQLEARLVLVFGPRTHYRGVGVASAVDDAEQSFNFTARRGRLWEFYVDDATQITNRAGDDLTFADLDDGDRLFVHAELRDDGRWWAVTIRTGR